MDANLKNFATYLVTQLVDAGILAQDVNGTWTLDKDLRGSVFSYGAGTSFHNKQELIDKIAIGAVNGYGQTGGMRAAG